MHRGPAPGEFGPVVTDETIVADEAEAEPAEQQEGGCQPTAVRAALQAGEAGSGQKNGERNAVDEHSGSQSIFGDADLCGDERAGHSGNGEEQFFLPAEPAEQEQPEGEDQSEEKGGSHHQKKSGSIGDGGCDREDHCDQHQQ